MNELLDQLNIDVKGIENQDCKDAFDSAISALMFKLPPHILDLLSGLQVIIEDNLIEGGGQASAEQLKVILDKTKCSMSLQESDDLLSKQGIIYPGDRARVLPGNKDAPWSCLVYELVHEIGHIVDGRIGQQEDGSMYNRLDKKFSPTKYGQQENHEAFAEAFTYWIFDIKQNDIARMTVEKAINDKGKL